MTAEAEVVVLRRRENCRALVDGWKSRPGIELEDVTLATPSREVALGLLAVSVIHPHGKELSCRGPG